MADSIPFAESALRCQAFFCFSAVLQFDEKRYTLLIHPAEIADLDFGIKVFGSAMAAL